MVVEEAEILVEPINIGKVRIKNRFVRSATHEWMATGDGRPVKAIGDIYEKLAIGEVGLVISGYAYISADGKGSPGQQGMHGNHVIPDHSRNSDRIHSHGSIFFAQLVHNGRHAFPTKENPKPMAPSELPIPGTKLLSRAMTESDIHRVIDDYVKAIGRSRTCRIDGVQLHCAHGFLLCSFISPFLNRREDDWGGNTERRTRIIVEILRKAKKKIPDYPIAVKMNVIDGVPGGIDLSEAVKIAKILSSEGVDAIETSGGIEEAPKDLTSQLVTSPEQEAYFREYSRAIKNKVDCPVILVGGLRSLKIMHQMITDGYADMISMSRPLVRDPLLVAGLINGRKSEATCVSCNKCFDESGVKCNRSAQKK